MKCGFRFLLMIFLMVGCQVVEDADDAATIVGGRCKLTKSSAVVLCIDFISGYDTNEASAICNTEFDRYAVSNGVTGSDFLSGDANACDADGMVGECGIDEANIFYYSNEWNMIQAESDCINVQEGSLTIPYKTLFGGDARAQ